MAKPRILAFAGSARSGSLNDRLVRFAAEQTRQAGGDVTYVNLRDYPMPLYNGDLESAEGAPAAATQLLAQFKAHDALLLACPEYNSSITPLLKNTIDWLSRPREGEVPLAAFKGKVAALLSASPGALGGLRGLVHVRSILSNIGVVVLPEQLAVPKANEAIAEDGTLTDHALADRVKSVCTALVDVAERLKAR